MNIRDIGVVYVRFAGKEGGKRRPIFVTSVKEETFTFFPITSQYEKKSDRIKTQYFPIVDWQLYGLVKPSWIDIGSQIEYDLEQVEFMPIGTLGNEATNALEEFIYSYPSRLAALEKE